MKLADILFPSNRGIYIARRLHADSARQLLTWCLENNIPSPVPEPELHCTVVFSERFSPGQLDVSNLRVRTTRLELFKGDKTTALVLLLESPELHQRHQQLLSNGATHPFTPYSPHVTLSYDAGDIALAQLNFPEQNILLQPEYIEPLRDT